MNNLRSPPLSVISAPSLKMAGRMQIQNGIDDSANKGGVSRSR